MRNQDIITVSNVVHTFSPETGVFNLNFRVPAGAIFGLIGPSGCGKTTTVRLLTGLYRPEHGNIRVLSHTPHTFSARIRKRLGYMPQHFVLYPNLTVWENLSFVASLYGMNYFTRGKRLREVLDFVELTPARNRLSRHLSGGMQRRLELACALAHNPVLIFADEPTAGIDPVLRHKFWEHFRWLRDNGRTLFITTQYIGEAAYCDQVGVMGKGRLLYVDTPEGLRRQALGGEVIRLGVDEAQMHRAVQVLRHLPFVHRIRYAADASGVMYVYVEDAGEVIPILIKVFDEQGDLSLRQIEAFQPPFDDIFIVLMQQAESNQIGSE